MRYKRESEEDVWEMISRKEVGEGKDPQPVPVYGRFLEGGNTERLS